MLVDMRWYVLASGQQSSAFFLASCFSPPSPVMHKTLTLVSLLSLAAPAFTTPCAVFDAQMNLYAFGLNGKDWNAGTQDTWASGACPTWLSHTKTCR